MNAKQMEQRLAWYANGTLPEAERAEVDAWLVEHPEARLQLAEYSFLQHTVSEVTADEPQLATTGFDELLAQVDQFEAAQSAQQTTAHAVPVETTTNVADGMFGQRLSENGLPENGLSENNLPENGISERELSGETVKESTAAQSGLTGFLNRITNWVAWQTTPGFARVAVVAQFALVAVLGTALFLPQQEQSYDVLSGPGASTTATAALQLDIGLNPALTMEAFQALLHKHQAEVVSGPNSLGIYRIQLQDETRIASLRAHSAVLYLQRVQP
ncbi:MAG: hypothetical protein OIF57_13770 [Marinobacterium sp.]|nr:hypothetical protein [Marinobacterium sp.]